MTTKGGEITTGIQYCKSCCELSKIYEFKNAGCIIYSDKNTNGYRGASKCYNDLPKSEFILKNINSTPVKVDDCTTSIDPRFVRCPRCKKVLEHVQKLLLKFPDIKRNEMTSICDHCLTAAKLRKACECSNDVHQLNVQNKNMENTKINNLNDITKKKIMNPVLSVLSLHSTAKSGFGFNTEKIKVKKLNLIQSQEDISSTEDLDADITNYRAMSETFLYKFSGAIEPYPRKLQLNAGWVFPIRDSKPPILTPRERISKEKHRQPDKRTRFAKSNANERKELLDLNSPRYQLRKELKGILNPAKEQMALPPVKPALKNVEISGMKQKPQNSKDYERKQYGKNLFRDRLYRSEESLLTPSSDRKKDDVQDFQFFFPKPDDGIDTKIQVSSADLIQDTIKSLRDQERKKEKQSNAFETQKSDKAGNKIEERSLRLNIEDNEDEDIAKFSFFHGNVKQPDVFDGTKQVQNEGSRNKDNLKYSMNTTFDKFKEYTETRDTGGRKDNLIPNEFIDEDPKKERITIEPKKDGRITVNDDNDDVKEKKNMRNQTVKENEKFKFHEMTKGKADLPDTKVLKQLIQVKGTVRESEQTERAKIKTVKEESGKQIHRSRDDAKEKEQFKSKEATKEKDAMIDKKELKELRSGKLYKGKEGVKGLNVVEDKKPTELYKGKSTDKELSAVKEEAKVKENSKDVDGAKTKEMLRDNGNLKEKKQAKLKQDPEVKAKEKKVKDEEPKVSKNDKAKVLKESIDKDNLRRKEPKIGNEVVKETESRKIGKTSGVKEAPKDKETAKQMQIPTLTEDTQVKDNIKGSNLKEIMRGTTTERENVIKKEKELTKKEEMPKLKQYLADKQKIDLEQLKKQTEVVSERQGKNITKGATDELAKIGKENDIQKALEKAENKTKVLIAKIDKELTEISSKDKEKKETQLKESNKSWAGEAAERLKQLKAQEANEKQDAQRAIKEKDELEKKAKKEAEEAAKKVKEDEIKKTKEVTDKIEKKPKEEGKLNKDKTEQILKEPVSEKNVSRRDKIKLIEPWENFKELDIKSIPVKDNKTDNLILQLLQIKQEGLATRRSKHNQPTDSKVAPKVVNKQRVQSAPQDSESAICNNSDLELELESLKNKNSQKLDQGELVLGHKILKYNSQILDLDDEIPKTTPILFKTVFKEVNNDLERQEYRKERNSAKCERTLVEGDYGKGVIRYALSDRSFIEKGWTMLPTEKVVRKMNVYRMRPAHPEFDWFAHNKSKKVMHYDSGEKLADFDDSGRGRWYYRNGRVALDYYDAEELNAQQRFVIYSSGMPDERGRTRPNTVLATFDYLGNGIVFDHSGKIRLKYNQTEGVVLDRSLGPVSHWKWHTLNDPPVLQQVMIDTQMPHKDPTILKMGTSADNKARVDNEEMLAIEFDNFIKEKSKKLSQKFKPFQIKMKALKINEQFSLRVLDQASIYLIFRDGTTNLKLNLGMLLDHQEIVDTDTAEVGEVSNPVEKLPAKTDSLAGLQRSVMHAQHVERVRVEHARRLRPTMPGASADRLTAAMSRPLRTQLRTISIKGSVDGAPSCTCVCRKLPPTVCYDNRL